MKHLTFWILIASISFFACEKEQYYTPKRPLGYQYAGLWKTDSTAVNSINATNSVNALLWLGLDSTISQNGEVSGYVFSGIYEETERSQFNYLETERASGSIRFYEHEPHNPWEPSVLSFQIYYTQSVPCLTAEESYCSNEIVLKNIGIKNSTSNMITVETEIDSIKRFYRFIRQ